MFNRYSLRITPELFWTNSLSFWTNSLSCIHRAFIVHFVLAYICSVHVLPAFIIHSRTVRLPFRRQSRPFQRLFIVTTKKMSSNRVIELKAIHVVVLKYSNDDWDRQEPSKPSYYVGATTFRDSDYMLLTIHVLLGKIFSIL